MAFPVNVPNVPGVPAVLFADPIGAALTLLTRDAVSLFLGSPASQWGIYRGGAPVVVSDNVVTFDYRQQWSLSDFPIERGAFESYDKVQIPFDARFKFSAGGSAANRAAFLASIAAIAGTLELYDVVTPETIYIGVNVTHYDYSRSATNGVGLISVDVWTQEVRIASSGIMTDTASPLSEGQVNGGTVQPTEATPAQTTMGTEIRGPHQELS